MCIKIKDCTVNISFLFTAFLAFVSIFNRIAFYGLFAVVIHELGHLLVMYWLDCLPKQINIDICNIDIVDSAFMYRFLKQSIYIFVAGSALNMLSAVIFLYVYHIGNNEDMFTLLILNIGIACFNLLPIKGLDGGSILHCILCKYKGEELADKILTIVSFVAIAPLAVVGVYILIVSEYNFSLLLLSCFLVWKVINKRK